MADVTIYKPAGVTVDVIDGDPPADQSALVAQLQARVAELEGVLADVKTRAEARKAADNASVDGQADIDAINGVGL